MSVRTAADEAARAGARAGCLGVIMPAFNEAGTVAEALRRVLAQGCVAQVVVVDDGSSDDTAGVVRSSTSADARLKLVQHPVNRGKGAAIRTALAHVTAPIVIIQDADLEYDPRDYGRLMDVILKGEADVVYGSRFMPGARTCTTWVHRAENWLITAAANLISGARLTDEATCYKLFRRGLLERLSTQEERFGFCPEVTIKLTRMGAGILEVPISYTARSRSAGKKLRLRDGLGAVWCLIKYSLRNKLARQDLQLVNDGQSHGNRGS